MRKESVEMINSLIAYIEKYSDCDLTETDTNKAFQELALQLFKFQFTFNPAYKKYAQARRKTPFTVKDWSELPPIPIQAFKELTLSCEPPEEAEAVFMTSGTTNADKKGKQYHPTFRVWDESMAGPFKHFVLPDRDRMTMFLLSPAEDVNRNSSLSRYLTKAVERFGTPNSRFFFSEAKGLDMDAVFQALQESEKQGEPLLLLGATFAYVHLLDAMEEQGLRFRLPAGSRVFDTGGLKGQAREITADELYARFSSDFGVERDDCINMYGMTELCSQFYDQTIRSKHGSGVLNRLKKGPAWVRTLVLDPDTLQPLPDGETGVLAHIDLANWNSALAILTEDTGRKTEKGLELLGRMKGSEARGCSIAVDQLLSVARKQDQT